jgi:hypothetical protein
MNKKLRGGASAKVIVGSEDKSLSGRQALSEIFKNNVQAWIALLSVLGVVGAFVVQHNGFWKEFLPHPKVQFEVQDSLWQSDGSLTIVEMKEGERTSHVRFACKDLPTWVNLTSGFYSASLSFAGVDVWESYFRLDPGVSRVFHIGPPLSGNIRVHAKIASGTLPPGAAVPLQILSSGNGFLWVYELNDNGVYTRIYPEGEPTDEVNAIFAEKAFVFPDSKDDQLYASKEEKTDTLLLLVTSQQSSSVANDLALKLSISTKASAQKALPNWGVSKVSYLVKKP